MFLRRHDVPKSAKADLVGDLGGEEWPDLSDTALATDADWLVPLFVGKTALAELATDDFGEALRGLLPWTLRRRLDA